MDFETARPMRPLKHDRAPSGGSGRRYKAFDGISELGNGALSV